MQQDFNVSVIHEYTTQLVNWSGSNCPSHDTEINLIVALRLYSEVDKEISCVREISMR